MDNLQKIKALKDQSSLLQLELNTLSEQYLVNGGDVVELAKVNLLAATRHIYATEGLSLTEAYKKVKEMLL